MKVLLPRILTADSLRTAIARLPIVARNSPDHLETSSFTFAPPHNENEIVFDDNHLEIVTAGGAVAYAALLSWIAKQTPRVGSTIASRKTKQKTSNSGKISTDWKMLVPATKVVLPNLRAAEKFEITSQKQVEVESRKIVVKAIDRIKRTKIPLPPQSLEWLFEACFECLLNVAQHSAETSDERTVEAIIALTVMDSAVTFGESGIHSSEASVKGRSDVLDKWEREAVRKGTWQLEIAVADIGRGFTSGLKDKIQRDNLLQSLVPDSQKLTGQKRFRALQNAALAYALTPYGSRKDISYFSETTLADSWRGLFRILFQTVNLDGNLIVTSGHGKYGGTGIGGKIFIGPRETSDFKQGVPWTSIGATIPLTASQAENKVEGGAPEDARYVGSSHFIQVFPDSSIDRLSEETLPSYAESIVRQVQLAWREKVDSGSLMRSKVTQYWTIVHPSLPIVSDADLDVNTTQIRKLEGRARVIAKLIVRLMIPGPILLHAFLLNAKDRGKDFSELCNLVQEYVASLLSRQSGLNPTPDVGIHGLISPGRLRVKIIFSQKPPSSTDSSISIAQSNERSSLWQRLTTFFHEADALANAKIYLTPTLMEEAGTKYLDSLVQLSSARNKSATSGSWYWRSGIGTNSKGWVKTPSGAESSEFLSVLGLCRANPTFMQGLSVGLSRCISNALAETPSKNLLIVPDSPHSSYLLMRKLEPMVRAQLDKDSLARVRFISPQRDRHSASPSDRFVIFADFCAEGTTIAARIVWLKNLRERMMAEYAILQNLDSSSLIGSADQLIARVYVAVDGTNSDSPYLRGVQVASFAKYRMHGKYRKSKEVVDKGPTEEDVYLINPVTGERLPQVLSLQMKSYLSVWSPSPITTTKHASGWNLDIVEKAPAKAQMFEYGIQYFAGRFFVCRWPVTQKLSFLAVKVAIAEAIGKLVEFISDQREMDVVLLCRSGSSLPAEILEIQNLLSRKLSRKGSNSQVLLSELETLIVGDRQMAMSGLSEAIERAMRSDGATSSAQKSLDLGLIEQKVIRPFILVFVDNSAVSGLMLQQVLSLASQLESEMFRSLRGVVLFPIITRLSTAEEFLFRHIGLRRLGTSEYLPGREYVPVLFGSLVQMRIPSYSGVEQVPLFQKLAEIFYRLPREIPVQLEEVRQNVQAVIDCFLGAINGTNTTQNPTITCPLLATPEHLGSEVVEMPVVELRQLIALHASGVPCWEALQKQFELLSEKCPSEVLMLLALEPSILEKEEFPPELTGDVNELCLAQLATSSSIRDCLNALWVAFWTLAAPRNVVQAIRKSIKFERHLLANLAFLVSYSETSSRSFDWAKEVADSFKESPAENVAELDQIFATLAFRNEFRSRTSPNSVSEAQTTIGRYLIENRYQHGVGVAAEWQRVREDLADFVRGRKDQIKFGDKVFKEWFELIFAPTYDAAYLLTSKGASFKKTRLIEPSEVFAKISGAMNLLQRKISTIPAGGTHQSSELVEIARKMLTYSTVQYSDELFTTPKDLSSHFQGNSTWPKSRSLLDWAIPEIVVEPVSSVFSQALALSNNMRLAFSLQYGEWKWRHDGIVGDAATQNFLRDLWVASDDGKPSAAGVMLLWGERASAFCEVTKRWLNEARRHGHLSGAIGLEIFAKLKRTSGSRFRLLMTIRNERKAISEPGLRRGFLELKDLIENVLNGEAKQIFEQKFYILELELDVDFYEFPKQ